MRSRSRAGSARAALLGTLFAATLLLTTGCLHATEETSIPPLPEAGARVDPGLGPEARPLSSGPGDKGSPSWSPRCARIAFTVDGYVVDKPVGTGDVRRLTTRDFVAEDVEWISESALALVGAASGAVPAGEAPKTVYRASSGEESLGVREVASEVLAMSPGPEGNGLIVALQTRAYRSEVAQLRDSGAVERIFTSDVGGRVTGLSLSPDGRKAALAVRARSGEDATAFELHTFDLRAGAHERVARLEEELEIFGAPQWTREGIYYVVGNEDTPGDGGADPLYGLYTVTPGSGEPEPAPGVGEDFVASSIRVSPDGERLAVIGRLNSKAPINLYILDLAAQKLEAVTTNEDMEIKTGPGDLAWSPGGESLAIVARGPLSEEPRVRAASKGALLEDFYNLYEIPVEGQGTTR
jgi:dipeptidyl aminopeptidase/acylaminoacyl peptidase